MKKFFLILFLGLFISNVGEASADIGKWNCQKINESKSKCIKNKEDRITKIVLSYIGEVKEGLPSGKGIIDFSYHPYVQTNWEKSKHLYDNKWVGVVKTYSDHSTELVEGYLELIMGFKEYFQNSSVVKQVFTSGHILELKNGVLYKMTFDDGSTFEGTFTDEPAPLKGTYIYASLGEKFVGRFFNNEKVEGIYYFKNGNTFSGTYYSKTEKGQGIKKGTYVFKDGDKFIGTFYKNSRYKNGTYYFASGGTTKYKNGKLIKTASKSSDSKTKKTSGSDTGSFGKYFLFSWIFTFILWGIVYAYFFVLGLVGKVVNKVPFEGFKNVMFFFAFALTWFLCWVFLFGFIPAIMLNALFIYLAAWGALGIGILHIIYMVKDSFKISKKTKKMFGKYESGAVIVFILFWCLLSLDFIPFLGKNLRVFLVSNNLL